MKIKHKNESSHPILPANEQLRYSRYKAESAFEKAASAAGGDVVVGGDTLAAQDYDDYLIAKHELDILAGDPESQPFGHDVLEALTTLDTMLLQCTDDPTVALEQHRIGRTRLLNGYRQRLIDTVTTGDSATVDMAKSELHMIGADTFEGQPLDNMLHRLDDEQTEALLFVHAEQFSARKAAFETQLPDLEHNFTDEVMKRIENGELPLDPEVFKERQACIRTIYVDGFSQNNMVGSYEGSKGLVRIRDIPDQTTGLYHSYAHENLHGLENQDLMWFGGQVALKRNPFTVLEIATNLKTKDTTEGLILKTMSGLEEAVIDDLACDIVGDEAVVNEYSQHVAALRTLSVEDRQWLRGVYFSLDHQRIDDASEERFTKLYTMHRRQTIACRFTEMVRNASQEEKTDLIKLLSEL